MGEIQFTFDTDVPGNLVHRTMVLENHHRSAIWAYLVNSLVPDDRDIHIVSQNRNYLQSKYEMSYEQASADTPSILFGALGQWVLAVGVASFVLLDRMKALRNRSRIPAA